MQENSRDTSTSTGFHIGPKAIGFGQIALGIGVILISVLTTQFTVFISGIVLVIWGATEIIPVVQNQRKGALPHLIWGSVVSGTGIVLLLFPGLGAAILSLTLAVLFVYGGVYKMISSYREQQPNHVWISAGGVLSVLLGLFIVSRWPLTSFVLLGVLIGVEILLNGWSVTVLEYAGKKARPTKFSH